MALHEKKTYSVHAKLLAESLEAILRLVHFHSSGSKLDIVRARRRLQEFKDRNRK